MLIRLALIVAFALGAPAAALAQAPATPAPITVSSPDGVLSVQVTADPDGRPSYAVSRLGRPVVAPSRLGFILTDAPKLERGLVPAAGATRTVDETWEQPWGERREVRNHFNELRVTFTERTALARTFDVVFRVYDDGLGFRYEFPQQEALTTLKIGSELTEFNIVDEGEAWWIPAWEWNREEYLYNRTPIDAVGTAQTPMTVRTEQGLHVSIHEAALIDYSGMNLRRAEGQRFAADLTPASPMPQSSARPPSIPLAHAPDHRHGGGSGRIQPDPEP